MSADFPSHCLTPPEDGGVEPLPECLARYTGFLIAKAHQRLWVRFNQECQQNGLEVPGFGILHLLEESGPMSQQHLGKLLRTDRTTMVKLLDVLESEKLARRTDHPEDRRMYLIEITPLGRKRLQEMKKVGNRMERELLAQFTDEERKVIRRALIAIAG